MEKALSCLVGPWLGLHVLPDAVDLAHFTRESYSFSDIVLSMIIILFLQKFKVFTGFVYLFTIYKHLNA